MVAEQVVLLSPGSLVRILISVYCMCSVPSVIMWVCLGSPVSSYIHLGKWISYDKQSPGVHEVSV